MNKCLLKIVRYLLAGAGFLLIASCSSREETYSLFRDFWPLPANPPSWSPDGDTIIFDEGIVQNVMSDQSNVMFKPNVPKGFGVAPHISPDGTRVVSMTSRYDNNTYEIITSDLDDGNVRRITKHKELSIWPRWSPDGERIAFARGSNEPTQGAYARRFKLYTMLSDGSDVQPLGHEVGEVSGPPVWSPYGSKLAFRNSGADALYVVNADGSGLRRIFDVPHPLAGGLVTIPAWSPDVQQIAFGVFKGDDNNAGDNVSGIYKVNADGSNLQHIVELAPDTRRIFSPSWSPDGSMIVFIADDVINVVNTDGSNLRKLADDHDFTDDFVHYSYRRYPANTTPIYTNFYRYALWSPNGERIAVSYHGEYPLVDGYTLVLITMARDGSDIRALVVDDGGAMRSGRGVLLQPEEETGLE